MANFDKCSKYSSWTLPQVELKKRNAGDLVEIMNLSKELNNTPFLVWFVALERRIIFSDFITSIMSL